MFFITDKSYLNRLFYLQWWRQKRYSVTLSMFVPILSEIHEGIHVVFWQVILVNFSQSEAVETNY